MTLIATEPAWVVNLTLGFENASQQSSSVSCSPNDGMSGAWFSVDIPAGGKATMVVPGWISEPGAHAINWQCTRLGGDVLIASALAVAMAFDTAEHTSGPI